MIRGTLNPATFAALADEAKMRAAISGNAAGLPSDFSGETLEEIAKDLTGKLNLSGSAWLKAFFARVPFGKLGIKVTSVGASNLLFNWLLSLTTLPQGTKDAINLVGRNLLQGVLASYIDTSADRGHEELDKAIHVGQTSEYVRLALDPAKPMIVLMTYPGGIKMIHPAAHDGAAYKDVVDSGAPPVPATTCRHCEDAYALFTATFRKETTTTGAGKDGKGGGGTKTTNPPAFRQAERVPLADAERLSKVQWCPDVWPKGEPAPAKEPAKADPWHTQVGPKGVALYDALIAFAYSTETKVDDIVAKSLSRHATKVDPTEWKDLAKQIKSDDGIYKGCWQKYHAKTDHAKEKHEGLTDKGFNVIIGRINGRVPEANIPPLAQAEIAAHNVIDQAKHIWHGIVHSETDDDGHEKPWSWKAKLALVVSLGTVVGIPLGYIAWAVASVTLFCAGVFGWWEDQAWNNYLILIGSIGAILWLACWYFGAAVERVFGGLIHTHVDDHGNTGLTDTARNITALFFGSGTVAMLLCDAGMILGIETYAIRAIVIPVVIASIIAYDRYAATGHGSEAVHHLVEHLKVKTIGRLAAIASFAAVIGIGPLSYIEYQKLNTSFQVVVEQKGGAFYVPTPKGGAFAPEDVLGNIKATFIEGAMTHKSGPVTTVDTSKTVCLPVGTALDLPGYAEMVQPKNDPSCAAGTVSWAVRENVTGRLFDGGPKEYGSLAEMPAAEAKAKAEADRLAAGAQAKAELEAKAKADAEALAKAQAKATTVTERTAGQADPVRTVVSDADRCAQYAAYPPHLRATQGCK